MPTLVEIEQFTAAYADKRHQLNECVRELGAEIEKIKTMRMPLIRQLAIVVAALHADLAGMISASPELFVRPRTHLLHGIKIGLTKRKGSVGWDDEAAVIKRIRAQLPADQAELLIRVTESVHKPSVYDLTAADLKRIGIRVVDDGDEPVIKSTDGEIDKLVAALLAKQEPETVPQ